MLLLKPKNTTKPLNIPLIFQNNPPIKKPLTPKAIRGINKTQTYILKSIISNYNYDPYYHHIK